MLLQRHQHNNETVNSYPDVINLAINLFKEFSWLCCHDKLLYKQFKQSEANHFYIRKPLYVRGADLSTTEIQNLYRPVLRRQALNFNCINIWILCFAFWTQDVKRHVLFVGSIRKRPVSMSRRPVIEPSTNLPPIYEREGPGRENLMMEYTLG